MDSATVRAKVGDHAERLSRLTMVERRKAQAQDRASVVESLVSGGECLCWMLSAFCLFFGEGEGGLHLSLD